MRKALLFGKKARLLATALWKELLTGSRRERTRSAKVLTISASGREDESASALHFQLGNLSRSKVWQHPCRKNAKICSHWCCVHRKTWRRFISVVSLMITVHFVQCDSNDFLVGYTEECLCCSDQTDFTATYGQCSMLHALPHITSNSPSFSPFPRIITIMGAAVSSSSGVPAARASRRPPPSPLPPSSGPSDYTLRALEWQRSK